MRPRAASLFCRRDMKRHQTRRGITLILSQFYKNSWALKLQIPHSGSSLPSSRFPSERDQSVNPRIPHLVKDHSWRNKLPVLSDANNVNYQSILLDTLNWQRGSFASAVRAADKFPVEMDWDLMHFVFEYGTMKKNRLKAHCTSKLSTGQWR